MFAKHPAEFSQSSQICQKQSHFPVTPFSMTNLGLRIELPLVPCRLYGFDETYVAVLNCGISGLSSPLGIHLERSNDAEDLFFRVEPQAVVRGVEQWNKVDIQVLHVQDQEPSDNGSALSTMRQLYSHIVSFQKAPSQGDGFVYNRSAFKGLSEHFHVGKKRIVITIRPQIAPGSAKAASLSVHYFSDSGTEWFALLVMVAGREICTNIVTPSTGQNTTANAAELDQSMFLIGNEMSLDAKNSVSQLLSDSRMVLVDVRTALLHNKKHHDIRISIRPSTTPSLLQVQAIASPRQIHDIFTVILSPMNHLHSFIPTESWRTQNGLAVLMSNTNDTITGSFLSGDPVDYAISLGTRNGRVWADVVPFSWSTKLKIEEIRASYDRNGRRKNVPALHHTRIVEPLYKGNAVTIEINGTRHLGQEGFQTKISEARGSERERCSELIETKFLEDEDGNKKDNGDNDLYPHARRNIKKGKYSQKNVTQGGWNTCQP